MVVVEIPQDDLQAPEKSASDFTPSEMVEYLDRFIVGQTEAKKACANALRNRWRRQRLPPQIRDDVMPKNILMIGPTGVGKTEIARRLSKLVDSPFVKVEATKFTEVGYRGKDVEEMLKDLMEVGLKSQRAKLEKQRRPLAIEPAEQKIIEALVGKMVNDTDREVWLKHLRSGGLEDRMVTVDLPVESLEKKSCPRKAGNAAGGELQDFFQALQAQQQGQAGASGGASGKTEKKRVTVKEAREKLIQAELDKMISQEEVLEKAVQSVEQEGIVFIDEIDKVCSKQTHYGPDASAEGVQRDLLPLIEGCSVTTRHGEVKTDHILFIASGAFHSVKPSDLLAELQGRLPVRVELNGLKEEDFKRILTEPDYNLIRQNTELLRTEGVDLIFTGEAIGEIAKVSAEVNARIENIGARRLYTVVEKILEDISYQAPDLVGTTVEISGPMVREAVGEMLQKVDLYKHIL